MTYKVKSKRNGLYQVQIKGWWTLWIWQSLLAFEGYDQANEYVAYRECAKYRKASPLFLLFLLPSLLSLFLLSLFPSQKGRTGKKKEEKRERK